MKQSENAMYAAACRYVKAGCAVVPVVGKEPCGNHGFHSARAKPALVNQLWNTHQDATGVGVAVSDGCIILDVDARHGGSLEQLGDIPTTPIAKTGGGGHHVYFRLPAGVTLKAKDEEHEPLRGIAVKVAGMGVVAPPSIHPDTGIAYAWEPGRALGEVAIAELPEHLVTVLKMAPRLIEKDATWQVGANGSIRTSSPQFWLDKAVSVAVVGSRYNTGANLARQWRDNCPILPMHDWEAWMLAYVAQVPQPADDPYTESKALATLHHVFEDETSREPAQPIYSASLAQSPSVFTHTIPEHTRADKTIPDNTLTHVSVGSEEVSVAELMDPLYGITDTQRRQLLIGSMALDALPSEPGPVTYPQSNAGKRRMAQENYWQRYVWPAFFPGNFPPTTLSTAVNLVQKHLGPGAELQYLTRHLFAVVDNPHKQPDGWAANGKNPVGPFMSSLRYALLPRPADWRKEKQDEQRQDEVTPRREQKQDWQTERRKRQEEGPVELPF